MSKVKINCEAEHLRYIRRLKPIGKWMVEPSRWDEVLVRELGLVSAFVFLGRVKGCMDWLSPGFTRGRWVMYELEGGGCFLAPSGAGKVRLRRHDRGFDETVELQSAGLCASMFATTELQLDAYDACMLEPRLGRQTARLTRFMRRQPEASALTRVLD